MKLKLVEGRWVRCDGSGGRRFEACGSSLGGERGRRFEVGGSSLGGETGGS